MRKNLVIKILVILIAVLLWLQQVLQKVHEIDIQVPIILQNLSADFTLEQVELPEITVSIRAKGYEIITAKLSAFSFQINASKYKYGRNLIKLNEKDLTYPKRINLEVLDIDYDDDLYINLDKLAEKHKLIQIDFASSDDEEFFIENKISNERQRVLVSGPLEILNEIEYVKTEPIDRKMIADGKVTANLIIPNPEVQLEKDKVVYNVTQTKIVNKTISLIPIKFPETENITIIPQKVSAMVSGPEEIVEELKNYSIEANLDLNSIHRGFTGVKFDLPSGVKLVEYTPQRIQVILNEEDSGL
ncbi:MAG: hypothetical protein K9N09_00340 [Candidatus Cloacimonetes bacterium]|nr:hypothetical protein [Candidatus Cloacimonadota bacterium]MCF7812909.1 hypothetical protein [Candidatus Cloacimonadota bacterium]MCF7867121.1 hypothetical protein [Candidatus Cloacimonadota bacterium]MCF7882559.1 hypothetical protein [Candidatus Cloacimonadota bacterium]